MFAVLFFAKNTKKKHYDDEKQQERRATVGAPSAQGRGRADNREMVCTDADGGTGAADGADGEADRELCVQEQHGTVGAEVGGAAVG